MLILGPMKYPYKCKKCGKEICVYPESIGDLFNDPNGELLPKEYKELCKDGKKHEWEKEPVIF